MNTETKTPSPGVSRWTLRFVLLGGGVAWTLHLLLAYVIAEFGIVSGFVDTRWAELDAVSWLLIALSAAMLALAAVATWVSWRMQYSDAEDEQARTVRFCVRFGRAANLSFLVIIAVQSIPIFFFLRVAPSP